MNNYFRANFHVYTNLRFRDNALLKFEFNSKCRAKLIDLLVSESENDSEIE